jgi:hypothetical protein
MASDEHRRNGGDASGRQRVPGVDADQPSEIPAGGWWQVVKRAWAEAKAEGGFAHHVAPAVTGCRGRCRIGGGNVECVRWRRLSHHGSESCL